jgi:hypothetical protein
MDSLGLIPIINSHIAMAIWVVQAEKFTDAEGVYPYIIFNNILYIGVILAKMPHLLRALFSLAPPNARQPRLLFSRQVVRAVIVDKFSESRI